MNIIDMRTCPRCNNVTLFVDMDTKTGEYDSFCQECGHGEHISYQRDANGNFATEDISYAPSDLYFCVRDFETYDIIWKRNMSEVSGITAENIMKFVCGNDIFGEEIPSGINNVSTAAGESVITPNSKVVCSDKVIVTNIVLDYTNVIGYGIIMIDTDGADTHFYQVTAEDTKEDVKHKLIDMLNKADNVTRVTATWFNRETGNLENIEY